MKHLYKFSLLLLVLLLPTTALAHDFEVDGIYYTINGNEVIVTYWGTYNAYYDNEYTGDVAIPTTVTYGGTNYSVTSIGDKAFQGCTGLTSVSIPNSVTSIGIWAFDDCSGLTSVSIPNSVTTIGNGAFYGCSGLTSVTIPNSVTSIGYYAFENCSGLTSIVIPNSVTSIGESAFDSCSGLTSIVIPNSVTSIGDYAFRVCTGLTSITIPNSVTSIGNEAFRNCTGLTSVSIGNSVTSIGDYAFAGCTSLTSIDIPNSVSSIGYDAFYSTAWYNSQPNGLIYAGLVAYNYKGTMPNGTSINLRDGTLSITAYAFSECSNLTSITIPNSVTSIGDFAFRKCCGLTSIKVASGNPTYDSRNNCNAIIKTATNTLVVGCKNTNIPNSVTTIGDYAFYYCIGLTSVTIPNSVTTIGDYGFSGCYALSSVTIGDHVDVIGGWAFEMCESLTRINIPNSVTIIGPYAFLDCWILNSVSIPNSVTYIGDGAFINCGLSEVYSVHQRISNIEMGQNVFGEPPTMPDFYVYSDRKLYVPAGFLASYGQAITWYPYFGTIVEMEPAMSIELNVTTASLNLHSPLQLTATVLPENATNKKVAWASSNPTVATVDADGLVSAHAIGIATIFAMTTDGSSLSASCTVKVSVAGLTGDVNGDGIMSIADVTTLIDAILTGEHEGVYFESADLNSNGRLDIGDVTTIIDMLLNDIE